MAEFSYDDLIADETLGTSGFPSTGSGPQLPCPTGSHVDLIESARYRHRLQPFASVSDPSPAYRESIRIAAAESIRGIDSDEGWTRISGKQRRRLQSRESGPGRSKLARKLPGQRKRLAELLWTRRSARARSRIWVRTLGTRGFQRPRPRRQRRRERREGRQRNGESAWRLCWRPRRVQPAPRTRQIRSCEHSRPRDCRRGGRTRPRKGRRRGTPRPPGRRSARGAGRQD